MIRNRYRSPRIADCPLALSLIFCLALSSLIRAQDQTMAQMVHTSWTGRDGAPAGIRSLAQTADGMLWIASLKGLYSFDGLSFVPFQPAPGSASMPAKTLRLLFVSKSGDLWVAGYHGAPVQVHHGRVTEYNRSDQPIEALDYLQQDSSGAIWAVANDRQLVRLGGEGTWHSMPGPSKGQGHIVSLLIDSIGTQWVIQNNVLYRRPRGLVQFLPTQVSAYFHPMIREGVDHTVWIIGALSRAKTGTPAASSLQQVDQSGQRLTVPRDLGDLSDILQATDGSLWIMKANDELRHLRTSEISARNSERKHDVPDVSKLIRGTADKEFHAFMYDADGNVWVGGLDGLERFAHATLVPVVPGAAPGFWSSCVGPRGDVLLSHQPTDLYRTRNGNLVRIDTMQGGGNLFCSPNGTFYLDANGIATLHDGKQGHLPLLPGFSGYGDHYVFTGVLPLPDGSLIAAVGGVPYGTSLWIHQNSKWSRFLPNQAFPETSAMFRDSRGIIYLGHLNGDINLVSGEVPSALYKGSDRFNEVLGFAQTSAGVFAYGPEGIGIVRQSGLQIIKFANSEYSKGVTGLVEAQNGDVWINGFDGIVHIPSAEIHAALSNPDYAVSATTLQEQNFKGPSDPTLFSSTAHIDPSGKLWFSTLNGVVTVDPRHLASPHPPLLTIRSITADGSAPNAHNEFSPNISTLDVQYLGVNLSDPRRVVYRYQLQGLDAGWQDVGHRAEAIFTHLRPGRYIFRVMASNDDGAWTEAIASTPFTVLPSFYQTRWFTVLCIVTCIALIWVGVTARVRYVSAAIKIRAEERADERVRIARELHDTLLQGVQGLLLSFHVAAEKVPADHVSKKTLEKALTTADRIIEEGRNRVSRLRAENLNDAELKSLIEGVAANFNAVRAIDFAVERKGGSNALRSHVVEEVFCIGREAVTNAFCHSQASRVRVELDYHAREFRMSCRDNGRGFDAEAFCALQNNGHWGLRGMEERAQSIGAKLSLTSAPDKGTEVHITMPARLAYVRHRRFENFVKGREGWD
jgi:signal transduction histidine kinase/ligand-binding sensor domain-containing protein